LFTNGLGAVGMAIGLLKRNPFTKKPKKNGITRLKRWIDKSYHLNILEIVNRLLFLQCTV
jgi:hypothetical protein